MKKIILSTTLITLTLIACKTAEKTTAVAPPPPPPPVALDCSTRTISYAADIKPILEEYCNRCHGDAGGLDFTQLADVKRAATKGELLGTTKHLKGFPRMPDGAPMLDQPLIDKIECWINTGMKD